MSWQGALVQTVNVLLLLALIVGLSFFIGKDARSRNHSRKSTLLWILASISLFPIGLILYLWLGRMSWQGALVQTVNVLLLLALIVGLSFFIGKDARSRNHSRKSTLLWILASICFFPIGVILYLWLGRKSVRKVQGENKYV